MIFGDAARPEGVKRLRLLVCKPLIEMQKMEQSRSTSRPGRSAPRRWTSGSWVTIATRCTTRQPRCGAFTFKGARCRPGHRTGPRAKRTSTSTTTWSATCSSSATTSTAPSTTQETTSTTRPRGLSHPLRGRIVDAEIDPMADRVDKYRVRGGTRTLDHTHSGRCLRRRVGDRLARPSAVITVNVPQAASRRSRNGSAYDGGTVSISAPGAISRSDQRRLNWSSRQRKRVCQARSASCAIVVRSQHTTSAIQVRPEPLCGCY